MPRTRRAFPLWIKVAYTAFVALIVPVYVRQYGWANFLWFSDIALFGTAVALWLESPLLTSTVMVGAIGLELAWNVEFFQRLFTGKKLAGLAAYMFDPHIPLLVRGLSLFHVFVPVLLIWMIRRLRYDGRAFFLQILVAWVVLPASHLCSTVEDNVNWSHGLGTPPRTWGVPQPVFVGLLMIAFPVLLYLPTHMVLARVFGARTGRARA